MEAGKPKRYDLLLLRWENPKSEARNPKQIRMKANSKFETIRRENPRPFSNIKCLLDRHKSRDFHTRYPYCLGRQRVEQYPGFGLRFEHLNFGF
jgi:hypothetical protein